jgi:glutamate racemase
MIFIQEIVKLEIIYYNHSRKIKLKEYIKILYLLFILPILFTNYSSVAQTQSNIEDLILSDSSNYYYIDVKNYPAKNKSLPIGIFDSGTGGLTVMDAIINYDGFTNNTRSINPDGVPDFDREHFIYLADQANMPYGNYPSAGKTDLLKEHIIKDVQFLLNNKYYLSASDTQYKYDKSPVKAIVIACNTATAYGMEDIESFIRRAELDIRVIGVVNAGVEGAFENISTDEECSIGVMATEGTVLSKGYVNTINKYIADEKYNTNIETFQQPGVGLAGAIDGVIDYISYTEEGIRNQYKGPSMTSKDARINVSILNRYDFDWTTSKLFYSGSRENPEEIQLNSIENYIYYHIVSLLEQIKNSPSPKPLKVIILGCTHYPFYKEIFSAKLKQLYNLKEEGEYVYRPVMHEEIVLIDPAINTAKELYKYLQTSDLFAEESMERSEFYISVPNLTNQGVMLDSFGNFTYDYKYGREAGMTEIYVKPVPFSKANLGEEVIEMLKEKTPRVYSLIKNFNRQNVKLKPLYEKGEGKTFMLD